MPGSHKDVYAVHEDRLDALAPSMRVLLRDVLRFPSVSGDEGPLVHFLADRLGSLGLEIDLFETDESALAGHGVGRHLPLAGRPTLVVTRPGNGAGRSLTFNAHSDVVPAGDPAAWTHPPFAGVDVAGRFFGRGACDVKGPLVSAIWAVLASPAGAGDVSIEIVPGEEDCVTLGTLTSVLRGHTADACVVLEPTECLPRNASRAGLRFEITCRGRAVHGTVKWAGNDAIRSGRAVLDCLDRIESEWNDPSPFRITRPVTVDRVDGGIGQGMIADRCRVAGYLELLPDDDVTARGRAFAEMVLQSGVLDAHELVSLEFVERYPGHLTISGHPLCMIAESAVGDTAGFSWCGFNSGCEAGLRANLSSTPTLVWGPGSLEQAHAVDEFVDFDDVRLVAGRFIRTVAGWCG